MPSIWHAVAMTSSPSSHSDNLLLVGGGQIGEALLAGLLKAGRESSSINVVEPHPPRAEYLRSTFSVDTVELADSVATADVIVLAVKPYQIADVCSVIASSGAKPSAVVVSLAAGVNTASMEACFPAAVTVIRVMPNTPMLRGKGVSAVCGGQYATAADIDRVVDLMSAVGVSVAVQESHMDTVTALSGSGPAYIFLLAEAMIDAGVQQGLPRDLAAALVSGTIEGAGAMLVGDERSATELRYGVTSPGGTTAAGVRALEDSGLRISAAAAVDAASARSAELAAEN